MLFLSFHDKQLHVWHPLPVSAVEFWWDPVGKWLKYINAHSKLHAYRQTPYFNGVTQILHC